MGPLWKLGSITHGFIVSFSLKISMLELMTFSFNYFVQYVNLNRKKLKKHVAPFFTLFCPFPVFFFLIAVSLFHFSLSIGFEESCFHSFTSSYLNMCT